MDNPEQEDNQIMNKVRGYINVAMFLNCIQLPKEINSKNGVMDQLKLLFGTNPKPLSFEYFHYNSITYKGDLYYISKKGSPLFFGRGTITVIDPFKIYNFELDAIWFNEKIYSNEKWDNS